MFPVFLRVFQGVLVLQVHVKPSNLLLTGPRPARDLKLADCGLARFLFNRGARVQGRVLFRYIQIDIIVKRLAGSNHLICFALTNSYAFWAILSAILDCLKQLLNVALPHPSITPLIHRKFIISSSGIPKIEK